MDKKDFIFPGVILGLVLVISIGLLLTHGSSPTLIKSEIMATSTEATSTPVATSTSATAPTPAPKPTPLPHGPYAYYPYGSVTLALDQPAVFKDGLGIRPQSVLDDSRCPLGVFCIQAGSVKITLHVSHNGVADTETIQTGQTITVGADSITLESAAPPRTHQGNPAPSAYRFTFTVQHGQ